ncbi:helix-turn-helix domain-containing protein [Modestobacter sp. L9-4]|uniref:helix-turn-helix transcriptional regulator n=1 Tax=Modestobacter sp. L9-4 TaxID=2851567 RepID=UPI001C782212|nr:helix-turn-helix transcriptional regulator [Modestobacter sp. L9-4]QXG77486.1 helix-turn-helix domain-containing protein [Modestobacter sp. L9-4]
MSSEPRTRRSAVQPESEEAQRGLPHALEVARIRAGLSREALARLAGMSRSTVLKIETGERSPSPLTLNKLAEALKVSPDELLAAGWVAAEGDPDKRRTRAKSIAATLLAMDSPVVAHGAPLVGGLIGGKAGGVLGLIGALASARAPAEAAPVGTADSDPAVRAAERIEELTRQVAVLTQRLADLESRLQVQDSE